MSSSNSPTTAQNNKRSQDESSSPLSPTTTTTTAAAAISSSSSAPAPKRSKTSHTTALESHHASCRDTSCTGCTTGELEITFTAGAGPAKANGSNSNPSAADLYRMALEERDDPQPVADASAKNAAARDNNDDEADHADPEARRKVVARLFEMAIEKFEAETTIPVTKGAPPVPTKASADLAQKFVFASCLLDFGVYFPLPDYIARAADLYSECVAFLEGDAGKAFQDSWGASAAQFALGRATMEMLRARHETLAAEDAEPAEDTKEETKAETVEAEMAEVARRAIDKGLTSVQSDSEAFVLQCITSARLFRDYAVLQRQRYARGHTESTKSFVTSFATSLAYLSRAESAYPSSISTDMDALSIRGACLFYTAQQATADVVHDEDAPKNTTDVQKAIKDLQDAQACLRKAIQLAEDKAKKSADAKDDGTTAVPPPPASDAEGVVQNLHLLGQALLLGSSIEEDETRTVELYEDAVSCLRKAFELDPDNEEVEDQLVQMGILDEEDNSDDNASEDLGSQDSDVSEDEEEDEA
ncbi:hypothetical protein HKX48_005304 [Thoreauomyces humboldtii]|nr:hypothetical protein HKX48_005304 [Thoreauomyces humboldtii]